jgi:DNA-binding MarR family transcriptional regulator
LFLSPHGANIDTIAETNGMTYQAVNRIANELETLGYVAKSSSPNSGVKRELLLTETGLGLIEDLVKSIGIVEKEISQIIGKDDFHSLESICGQLFRKTGQPGDFLSTPESPAVESSVDNVTGSRRVDLGIPQLMLFISTLFDDSRHGEGNNLRMSRLVSEANHHLVSWSDSARRTTADTIIDVELVADEIRRRYGKARLDALRRLIDTLSGDLD